MTMKGKSYTYRTSIAWTSGVEGTLASPGKPSIKLSAPPEFKGPEGNWSPENLLVAAVESCVMLTFLALARSRKLEFVAYSSEAEGLLEPVYGKLVVSKVTVKPKIVVKNAADVDAAREMMGQVEENCFISNSVESEVVLQPEIVAG
ncbi:MAG: OsmC family protein [Chloroflexi bacterium]|nr:OsmC family protein [Chloroflexota bacterium]